MMRSLVVVLLCCRIEGFVVPTTPGLSTAASRSFTPQLVYGRGDKRTKRGKIRAGSSGKSRPKLVKKDGPVDPYYTLREWGKRQDPPMTVEEVIDMKIEKLTQKRLTQEELLATVTPF